MDRPERGRTEYSMPVKYNIDGNVYDDDVYIPEDIFKAAMKDYLNDKNLDVQGTDEAVYNAFDYKNLDAIDNFADNPDFIGICSRMYTGSKWNKEDEDFYRYLYSDEIDDNNKKESSNIDLSEDIKFPDPYDHRKRNKLPTEIEKFLDSDIFHEWFEKCKKYNVGRIEKKYSPARYQNSSNRDHFDSDVLTFYFQFPNSNIDENYLSAFFKEFGAGSLKSLSMGSLSGYGYPDFRLYHKISDSRSDYLAMELSASRHFRIYSLAIVSRHEDITNIDLSEKLLKEKNDSSTNLVKACADALREKFRKLSDEDKSVDEIIDIVNQADICKDWDKSFAEDFVRLAIGLKAVNTPAAIFDTIEDWIDLIIKFSKESTIQKLFQFAGINPYPTINIDLSEKLDISEENICRQKIIDILKKVSSENLEDAYIAVAEANIHKSWNDQDIIDFVKLAISSDKADQIYFTRWFDALFCVKSCRDALLKFADLNKTKNIDLTEGKYEDKLESVKSHLRNILNELVKKDNGHYTTAVEGLKYLFNTSEAITRKFIYLALSKNPSDIAYFDAWVEDLYSFSLDKAKLEKFIDKHLSSVKIDLTEAYEGKKK